MYAHFKQYYATWNAFFHLKGIRDTHFTNLHRNQTIKSKKIHNLFITCGYWKQRLHRIDYISVKFMDVSMDIVFCSVLYMYVANLYVNSTLQHSFINSLTFAACAAAPADILFLLDSSRSEGSTNFQTQKDFVSKFVNFLNIGPNDVQVTVGSFSTAAYSFFNLNTYHNKANLLHAISQVKHTLNRNNKLNSLKSVIFKKNLSLSYWNRFFKETIWFLYPFIFFFQLFLKTSKKNVYKLVDI